LSLDILLDIPLQYFPAQKLHCVLDCRGDGETLFSAGVIAIERAQAQVRSNKKASEPTVVGLTGRH